jgi:nicotinate phosphoribosyltransferase
MENGRITYELPSLNEVRSAAKENLSNLPEKFKKLTNPSPYPVEQSKTLEELTSRLTKKLMKKDETGASGKT